MACDASYPSERLVLQRIRNRIIEYFELASSYKDQREYQQRVSFVHVPNEVINQWEDWVCKEWVSGYIEPTFSLAEQAAIKSFQKAWSTVCDETPGTLPSLDHLIGTPAWERLRIAASDALAVFRERGNFSEEHEEQTRA